MVGRARAVARLISPRSRQLDGYLSAAKSRTLAADNWRLWIYKLACVGERSFEVENEIDNEITPLNCSEVVFPPIDFVASKRM